MNVADKEMIRAVGRKSLEIWEQVEMGFLDESDFEDSRNEFYELIVRMIEKNPDNYAHVRVMEEISRVRTIQTSKDKKLKVRQSNLIDEVMVLIEEPNLHNLSEAKECLSKAEKIAEHLDRPWTMFGLWVEDGDSIMRRVD